MVFVTERSEKNPFDKNTFRKKFEKKNNLGTGMSSPHSEHMPRQVEPSESQNYDEKITEEDEIRDSYIQDNERAGLAEFTSDFGDIEARDAGPPKEPQLFFKRPKIKIKEFHKAKEYYAKKAKAKAKKGKTRPGENNFGVVGNPKYA
jgi:hypothetical protein